MKIISVLILVFCWLNSSYSEKARFDNYKLYTLKINTSEQLQVLRDIEEHVEDYEVWKSATIGHEADIMVPPHKLGHFQDLINDFGFESNLKIENVQTLIDNEQSGAKPRAFGWDAYFTYEEMYEWIDTLVIQYPQLTKTVIGESYQGREIWALELSYNTGNPLIFIESNIHAREWITSATVTWFLNELLTSVDPAVRDLAENIDWHIIPIFNVDGFVYTHTSNRLWRKTRQNHATICYGTDANRNFPFHWSEPGASADPCSETYHGPTEMSEPESQLLNAYLAERASRVNIYIAFHSYGQYVLLPFGHNGDLSDNHENLMAVGNAAKEGFARRNGTNYTVGPTYAVMYTTSGTTADWAYDSYNIRISYTFEFRGDGFGFVLPPEYIVPNAEETMDAIITMVETARSLGELDPK